MSFSKFFIDTQDYRGHLIRACSFRALLVFCLILFFLFVIALRLLWVVSDPLSSSLVLANASLDVAVTSKNAGPHRRDIVDREGRLLASDITTYSLGIDPRIAKKASESNETIINALTSVFNDIDPDYIANKLESRDRIFLIKRKLTPMQRDRLTMLGVASLVLTPEPSRRYFYETEFSHILGYTNVDNKGLSGIEKGYESIIQSSSADPLKLTLSLPMQLVLNRELKSAMEKMDAKGVAGIIMDVNTSEVLAWVSLPDFDPHYPARATSPQRFNRAAQRYELGSTFKIFGTALAIENGYPINSKLKYSIENSDDETIARLIEDKRNDTYNATLREIFVNSINAGSARLALSIGSDKQRNFLQSLGITDTTGLMLPEIMSPAYPSYWGDSETATISYGYGVATTPVHLATAVSAIVNGGIWKPASLLMSEDPRPPESARQVLSAKTSSIMRELMREVVTKGTGKKAYSRYYAVGGKTGTVEKLNENGEYSDEEQIATFIGFYPVKNPKLAIHLLFDEPQLNYFGGEGISGGYVAAPVMANLVESLANYADIVASLDQGGINK